MARNKPSPDEFDRIYLLRDRVEKYFIASWPQSWKSHGEVFTSFHEIHNKNAFYEAVESAIEQKLCDVYGAKAASKKRISKHSVRRFLTETEDKGFAPRVLNAFLLLIDEEHTWASFGKSAEPSEPATRPVHNRRKNFLLVGSVAAAFVLILIGGALVFSKKAVATSSKPKLTCAVQYADKFRKVIDVTYDISTNKFTTASLMFGQFHIDLHSIAGDTAFVTLLPTFTSVKLFLDDSLYAERDVLVTSEGWVGSINNKVFFPESTYKFNGVLHFTDYKTMQYTYGREHYYTSFINFKEFKADGDNLRFKADLMNGEETGGIWAHDVSVDIVGKEGSIVFNLLKPDAIVFASMKAARTDFSHGLRSTQLANLGVDLSEWKRLSVQTNNQRITIKLAGKTLIDGNYEGTIGEVVGLQFYMKGAGYVKNVSLNDKSID